MIHPAFVCQSNGIVVICDGTTSVVFDSLSDFGAVEPGWSLPDHLMSINVEYRGADVLVIGQTVTGDVVTDIDPAPYLALTDKAPEYAAAQAERTHPLYGVTDVGRARAIVSAQVVAELERRSSAAFALWPAHERNTFEQQLAEAEAYLADNQVATPLLSAIKLPDEAMADLARAIVGHSAAFKITMGQLMGAKRRHLAAITVADLDTLRTYDATAGWPSIA